MKINTNWTEGDVVRHEASTKRFYYTVEDTGFSRPEYNRIIRVYTLKQNGAPLGIGSMNIKTISYKYTGDYDCAMSVIKNVFDEPISKEISIFKI